MVKYIILHVFHTQVSNVSITPRTCWTCHWKRRACQLVRLKEKYPHHLDLYRSLGLPPFQQTWLPVSPCPYMHWGIPSEWEEQMGAAGVQAENSKNRTFPGLKISQKLMRMSLWQRTVPTTYRPSRLDWKLTLDKASKSFILRNLLMESMQSYGQWLTVWEPHAVRLEIQGLLFIEMMAAVGPAENSKNQTFHGLKIPRQQPWNLARTGWSGG